MLVARHSCCQLLGWAWAWEKGKGRTKPMRGWGMQQGWAMREKGWESCLGRGMARGSPRLDSSLARGMAKGSPAQGSSLARATRCQATAMARGNPEV